jgi:hypothetical protein
MTLVTSAYVHPIVLIPWVHMHLGHWTTQKLQKVGMEEHLSFPEVRRSYFNLQSKQMKITYFQVAASHPVIFECKLKQMMLLLHLRLTV